MSLITLRKKFTKMHKINPVFYKKQYIGHAQHEGPYLSNSYLLYEYMIKELHYMIVEADVVFTSDGIPVLHHGVELEVYQGCEKYSVNILNTSYSQLTSFSLSADNMVQITTVEDVLKLCQKYDVCVMLDLTFQHYTIAHLQTLYKIVCKYKMKSKTIWGDANIFKLSFIDRHLICQVGGSWGRKLLIKSFIKSFFCQQIIMSFSYYGGNIESFRKIVDKGHRLGFIMKVATVNDLDIANKFWEIGTDLINTDTLRNN